MLPKLKFVILARIYYGVMKVILRSVLLYLGVAATYFTTWFAINGFVGKISFLCIGYRTDRLPVMRLSMILAVGVGGLVTRLRSSTYLTGCLVSTLALGN